MVLNGLLYKQAQGMEEERRGYGLQVRALREVWSSNGSGRMSGPTGGIVAAGNGMTNGSYPKAFVNLLVLDKNYKFLDYGWDGINGGQQPVGDSFKYPHDQMAQEYTAREEGWIYVYVSNENSTLVEVYFDDVTITHTKSNLIQHNEYYPFGHQTANSWTRSGTTQNNYLANGGTELNKTTNLYDLEYRNYDQVLGRMNGVDPMATKYASLTPYNFSFNDPVTFTDVNGADPTAGNMAYYYAMQGPDGMSPGQESIMDPYGYGKGGGGVYWSPRTAGGYRMEIGTYTASMALNYGNLQNIRDARATTQSIYEFLISAWDSQHGGYWKNDSYTLFSNGTQALVYGMAYQDQNQSWDYTMYKSEVATQFAFTWASVTGSQPSEATVNSWLDIDNQYSGHLQIVGMMIPQEQAWYTGKHFQNWDIVREHQIQHTDLGYTWTTRVVTITYGKGTSHAIREYGYRVRSFIEYGTYEERESSPVVVDFPDEIDVYSKRFSDEIKITINNHLDCNCYVDLVPRNRLKATSAPHR